MRKIINVKVNGELVSSDTKISETHLCGNYCPAEVMLKCPKVKTCGNLPIMEYPFIEEGMQILSENTKRLANAKGDVRIVNESIKLVVTKCKRYEEAMKKYRRY